MSIFGALLVLLVFTNVASTSRFFTSNRKQKYLDSSSDDQTTPSHKSRFVRRNSKQSDTDINVESGPGKFKDITPIYEENNPAFRSAISQQDQFKMYFTNTLLIDKSFKHKWIEILEYLDEILIHGTSNDFTLSEMIEARSQLIAGIENDDALQVQRALSAGARFLMNYLGGVVSTINYTLIERAVMKSKTSALNVMLLTLKSAFTLPESDLNYKIFVGGLLIRAVQAGSEASFNLLLDSYNAQYLETSFLLQQAIARRAPVSIIARIMEAFSDIPEINMPYGRHADFPLHLAVKFNHPDAFAFIFHSTNLPKLCFNGDNLLPIHVMIFGSRHTFIERLFKQHPELKTSLVDLSGNTYLHLLAQNNHLETMKLMHRIILFDLTFVNNNRQTPLHVACLSLNSEFAAYLIRLGADVLVEDAQGITPLVLLARDHDRETFALGLESIGRKKQGHSQSLFNATQVLIRELRYEYVEWLMKRFPHLVNGQFFYDAASIHELINTRNIYNFPHVFLQFLMCSFFISPYLALFEAAALGKTEAVKVCVETGMSLDIKDYTNQSALDLAVRNKHPETTRYLLKFTGWTVSFQTGLNDFVFVLLNGASFNPNSPTRIQYQNRALVFALFFEYFLNFLNPSSDFNLPELTRICIQYEVFIHYHFVNTTFSAMEVSYIQQIESSRTAFAKFYYKPISSSNYPFLLKMLSSHPPKNAIFMRNFVNCNADNGNHVDPMILRNSLTIENLNLIMDYASIL